MEKVATDIYSFRKLRENGFAYVEKTAKLLPLVDLSIGSQFFIARPRRFGKSLLVSTLHCLFDGKRDLFRGLAIAAVLFPVFAGAGEKASSEILILSPTDGATVPLVRAENENWVPQPQEGRCGGLADLRGSRKHLGTVGARPSGVWLEWRCEHGVGKGCCGTYAVEVMKRRDGSVYYAAEGLKTNAVELVNLEAGEEYTCAVWCGKKIQGIRFFTEDVVPQWLARDGVGNVGDLGGRGTQDVSRLREQPLDKGGAPVDFRALPKWHVVRGVKNFRDLGGWTGLDGRRVRTGLLYRSARLEKIDEEGRRYVRDVLGVRTDLDLRRPDQVRELHGRSPLGEQVLFVNRSSTSYSGFGKEDGKKHFAETFRWFLKEARYPVVFHCVKGADRTGSWAFLLNGLLGVSEEDLRKDWELTHYANANPLFKHRTRYNSLLRTVNGYDGATLSEKIASYARSCGVTDDEIRAWREKMLEGPVDCQ